MTNSLSRVAKQQFFDSNGRPASGYKLFTYEAGTSTKLATYQDSGTGSPNSNPVVLDFRGECDLWTPPNVSYKYVLARPADTDPPTNPVWSVNNVLDSQLVTLYGGVDTGVANAYVLNFVANFSGYQDGIAIFWIPSNTNTGGSTVNVNGLGPVAITNQDGSALYLGQLQSNQFALILYKGTGFVLIDFGLLPTINTQNTSYTLTIGDANNIVLHDAGTLDTWTVPTNAAVAFPIGTSVDLVNSSSAVTLTVAAAVGVTLNGFAGQSAPITLNSGYSTRITKIATNTWQQVTPGNSGIAAGSFTGTLSGMTTVTTGSLSYITGNQEATIHRSGGSASITGTSNSTAMILSGVPAALRPKFDVRVPCYGVVDNSVTLGGLAVVKSDGTVVFSIMDNPPANFTAAGTKGLASGWTLTWPLF